MAFSATSKLIGSVVLILASLCQFSAPAQADDQDSLSFTTQCPTLLAKADDFARDCVAKARTQTRTWIAGGGTRGQPETHSVWFGEAAAGSHFGLICTLNWKRQIDYLGVAYSTNGENFKAANTAPIRYIDFNGNAGVLIDGKPVNFMIVRQFGTDTFPPHFTEKRVKNCESAVRADGRIGDVHGGGWVYETDDDGKLMLKTCIDLTACTTHEYIEFFPGGDRNIIYTYEWGAYSWLIRSGGALLVSKDKYEKMCGSPKEKRQINAEEIVFEVCDEPRNSIHQPEGK